MSILKAFLDKFKKAGPKGKVESPTKTDDVKVSNRIHRLVRSYTDYLSNAMHRLSLIDELLNAPKVDYVKGFHTKVTMAPVKGLGVITIIFDSESGDPLCAELKECE